MRWMVGIGGLRGDDGEEVTGGREGGGGGVLGLCNTRSSFMLEKIVLVWGNLVVVFCFCFGLVGVKLSRCVAACVFVELQLLVLFGAKMEGDGCWRDQGVSADKKSSFVHGMVYPDAHTQFEPSAGVF